MDSFYHLEEEDGNIPSPAEVIADVYLGQLGALSLGLLVGLLTSKDNKKVMGIVAFFGLVLAILSKLDGKGLLGTTKDYDDTHCCPHDCGCAADDDFVEDYSV